MNITRRKFLLSIPVFCGGAFATDAFTEPEMLMDRVLDKSDLGLGKRIVHLSDFHFKGDTAYGKEVVKHINTKEPDFAVFTGDLVESQSRKHLEEALRLISNIKAPCYGVPGNHDPKDDKSRNEYAEAFRNTGGRMLQNERAELEDFVFHGSNSTNPLSEREDKKKILLCHYPVVGEKSVEQKYDLILCGHSHGGQVRLPFLGALILPPHVGQFERGYYQTKAGDLYVNVGIGEYLMPIRTFCRPEITEIKT